MMIKTDNIIELANNISKIKQEIYKIKELGEGINCVEKNADRMLASLKMLELNICDVAEILDN